MIFLFMLTVQDSSANTSSKAAGTSEEISSGGSECDDKVSTLQLSAASAQRCTGTGEEAKKHDGTYVECCEPNVPPLVPCKYHWSGPGKHASYKCMPKGNTGVKCISESFPTPSPPSSSTTATTTTATTTATTPLYQELSLLPEEGFNALCMGLTDDMTMVTVMCGNEIKPEYQRWAMNSQGQIMSEAYPDMCITATDAVNDESIDGFWTLLELKPCPEVATIADIFKYSKSASDPDHAGYHMLSEYDSSTPCMTWQPEEDKNIGGRIGLYKCDGWFPGFNEWLQYWQWDTFDWWACEERHENCSVWYNYTHGR